MEDLKSSVQNLTKSTQSFQTELKIEQKRNNAIFERLTNSQLENTNSLKEMSNSMRRVSQEIYSSQENFKNNISSNLKNANREINLKFTELENYIKLLDGKLENCQQPRNSGDFPKGQKHVQSDFTTVQKPQVIPGHRSGSDTFKQSTE